MKIICVGDNVVDCYLDQQTYYPGGNAINVAVNCRRFGATEAAYMGIFGDDSEADHIKWVLTQEGVSYHGSRVISAASGHPQVSLTADGDRVFIGGPQDTAQHIVRIRLTGQDIAYIRGFDVCHSSCYSGIEPELASLSEATNVSFDFSTRHEPDYIDQVAPHLRYAFFSGSHLEMAELEEIVETCHSYNVEVVGITRGSEGAFFSKSGKHFMQPVKSAFNIVDTMGAGDSFIAAFLTHYVDGVPITEALDIAATKAAWTCGFFGGIGYPRPFEG
ncbi:PfkB family carbohydrate kinase [Alkalispirochaeta alkalica]|uniref:PfkB family carbohydrate kinase n=1 Tax=Alkalispirochaeta alkalica TaxID=46356 RepID=UPI00036F603C|nr:PfkB family carbohydrate kinase [Alkalispirochaeta alkalica]